MYFQINENNMSRLSFSLGIKSLEKMAHDCRWTFTASYLPIANGNGNGIVNGKCNGQINKINLH